MIKRKTKRRSSELAELDRASREIESRIQELEASLKRPSQQTRMRLDRNTMPPPDRVREGNQNRALRAVVARDGRATNMRRELRENFMLLGLLICAIAASWNNSRQPPFFSASFLHYTMSTPQIDVAYIAKLARIDLTEEETALFSKDLDKVLAYITKLESYDVTGIAPMNHPLPAMDVMREDIPETGFTQEEALSNAPQQSQGQFRTPKVVESA